MGIMMSSPPCLHFSIATIFAYSVKRPLITMTDNATSVHPNVSVVILAIVSLTKILRTITKLTGGNVIPAIAISWEKPATRITSKMAPVKSITSVSIAGGSLMLARQIITITNAVETSALETYLEEIKVQLAEIEITKPRNNLPYQERIALKDLKSNTEIVIKKADKGSTTVIMNKQDKITEGQTQLDDRKNYMPLETPMVKETSQKVA